MQINPEIIKLVLTTALAFFSILLGVNAFFIRRLIGSIDSASLSSKAALEQVGLLNRDMGTVKEAVKDIPDMKTDIAVIKVSIDSKRVLADIHNKLSKA